MANIMTVEELQAERERLAVLAFEGDRDARAALDRLDAAREAADTQARRDREIAALAAAARRRERRAAIDAQMAEATAALRACVAEADARWQASLSHLATAWTAVEAAARAVAAAGTLASAASTTLARVCGDAGVPPSHYARNFGGAEFDAEEQGRALRRAMREATTMAGQAAADCPWEPLAARLEQLRAEHAACA